MVRRPMQSDIKPPNPTFVLQGERERGQKATNANTFFLNELRPAPSLAERQASLARAVAAFMPLCVDPNQITIAVAEPSGKLTVVQHRSALDLWTVILGRHGASDILVRRGGISLRHMAILHRPGSPLQVWDLRSGTSLLTVSGTRFHSGTVTAPAALAVDDAWLLVGRGPAPASAWQNEPQPIFLGDGQSWLFTLEQYTIDYGEQRTPNAPDARSQLRASPEHLERGVLLGRSERCDAPREWPRYPSDLSRVHAMIVRNGANVYLLDTASSAQVTHRDLGLTRLKHLVPGDVFWLGRQTRLTCERA